MSQPPVSPTQQPSLPPGQYPFQQQPPTPIQPSQQQPYIAPYDPHQAEVEERKMNNRLLLLALVWFLPGLSIIFMIFVNSTIRSNNVQALVTPTSVPTATPVPTSVFVDLPVATARILPTSTPRPTAVVVSSSPVATTEWGIVKVESEVKTDPSANSVTVEKLKANTLVAWEKKLPDGTWYMRIGGGWLARGNVNIFSSREAALASLNS